MLNTTKSFLYSTPADIFVCVKASNLISSEIGLVCLLQHKHAHTLFINICYYSFYLLLYIPTKNLRCFHLQTRPLCWLGYDPAPSIVISSFFTPTRLISLLFAKEFSYGTRRLLCHHDDSWVGHFVSIMYLPKGFIRSRARMSVTNAVNTITRSFFTFNAISVAKIISNVLPADSSYNNFRLPIPKVFMFSRTSLNLH